MADGENNADEKDDSPGDVVSTIVMTGEVIDTLGYVSVHSCDATPSTVLEQDDICAATNRQNIVNKQQPNTLPRNSTAR